MKEARCEVLEGMRLGLDYYMKLAKTWANDSIEPEEGEVAELLGKLADDLRDAMVDIDDLLTF